MASYSVTWEIEIEADSPREAAETARALQRDPDAWCGVFKVWDEHGIDHAVDLDDNEEEE